MNNNYNYNMNNMNNMPMNNMNNDNMNYQQEPPRGNNSSRGLVLLLIIALLIGGAYYLGTKKQTSQTQANTEQKETVQEQTVEQHQEVEPVQEQEPVVEEPKVEEKKEEQKQETPKQEEPKKEVVTTKDICDDSKYVAKKTLSIKLNGKAHTLKECYYIKSNVQTPDGKGYILYKNIALDNTIVEKDIQTKYSLKDKNSLTKYAKNAKVVKRSKSILKDAKNGKEYFLHNYTIAVGTALPTTMVVISEAGKALTHVHVSDGSDAIVTFNSSNKGDRNLDENNSYANLDVHSNFIYILEDAGDGSCQSAKEYKLTIENGAVKKKLIHTYSGEAVMIAGEC